MNVMNDVPAEEPERICDWLHAYQLSLNTEMIRYMEKWGFITLHNFICSSVLTNSSVTYWFAQ